MHVNGHDEAPPPDDEDDPGWEPTAGLYEDLGSKAARRRDTKPNTREKSAPIDEHKTLPLLWLRDIEPVLDAQDFVQGVLLAGGAAVIYGESNSGKTFWATNLALHLAAGLEWNGRRVEQGGVVYVVLEGGHGFRNRVTAWREAFTADQPTVPFAAVPTSINLLHPTADVEHLINAITIAAKDIGRPIKLVVIDTLSRALAGGDENSSEDMGALVANTDRIRAETGACVLFVHHSGKDAARGARGHSLLRAAIDTEIEVKVDEETGTRTATVVKQRDLAKGATFDFRLKPVIVGQNRHREDVTTCIVEVADPASNVQREAKLTPDERGWLRDIAAFFDDPERVHERVRTTPDGPEIQGATRDEIRVWLVARGRLGVAGDVAPGGALSATDRSNLSRYLNRLKDKGKIGIFKEWIWVR